MEEQNYIMSTKIDVTNSNENKEKSEFNLKKANNNEKRKMGHDRSISTSEPSFHSI